MAEQDVNQDGAEQIAKLLADVQRIIRDNRQFVDMLKKDSSELDGDPEEGPLEGDAEADEEFEEL